MRNAAPRSSSRAGCSWATHGGRWLAALLIESLRGHADDRIDLRHDVSAQVRYDVERLHVLDDLRRTARSGDDAADVRVLQAPCKRKLRHRAAQIGGERGKQSDLLQLDWI